MVGNKQFYCLVSKLPLNKWSKPPNFLRIQIFSPYGMKEEKWFWLPS